MSLTKEEVYKKFQNVPLTFTSYYKFTFNFSADVDDYHISAQLGGNAEEIYRYDVSPSSELYLEQDQHYGLSVTQNGVEVYSEYTY